MITHQCTICESEDILFDSWSIWNKELQKMEHEQAMDKGHFCETCKEPCTIKTTDTNAVST